MFFWKPDLFISLVKQWKKMENSKVKSIEEKIQEDPKIRFI